MLLITVLLSNISSHVASSWRDGTVLGEIGRSNLESIGKYKTNPYNNNESENSLIVNLGGVSNTTQVSYQYSADNSNKETSNLKITSNYSLAYLRKVSDKLSLGIEVGVFNSASSTINTTSALSADTKA
ncbi:MAG: hypothetical protein LBQ34_02375 [Alphaproteobacteria bacterium]|jgi:hypothetical protein|nr:hypothetical protein [Alphaproteobacteria bacterium]